MKYKRELILVTILFFIASAWALGQKLLFSAPAAIARVSADGEVIASLDLNKEQEFLVTGLHRESNHLIVKGGAIWCESASCPDKVCVRQGKQSQNGSTIACLPNRMIVTIVAE